MNALLRRRRQCKDRCADVAATSTAKPKFRKRCAASAVVVDFPFVPVIATKVRRRDFLPLAAKQFYVADNFDPACRAFRTVQCGAGCVNGTPGERTRASKFRQSAVARFSILRPARGLLRACSLSSQTDTRAPPATSACAVTNPERQSNTAACLPSKQVTGVIVTSISRSRGQSAQGRKQ